MRSIATMLLLLATLSCQKTEEVTPDILTGTWVEASARRDTLVFNPVFQGTILDNTLIVKQRRTVDTAGRLVPEPGLGFGIYKYKIEKKRIYVQGGTSGLAVYYADFGIQQQGNELLIDNFYEVSPAQPATAVRTLVRL